MRLAGSVVIVDEAHNLVGAVNSAHSAVLTAAQLETARMQLAAYHQRFQARLAPGESPSKLHITTEAHAKDVDDSSNADALLDAVNALLDAEEDHDQWGRHT